MKKNNKGFTLIELLAVVVVLGLTFMFVGPKLVVLLKDGENKEIEIIEERILNAAKEYVNSVDGSFYTEFYNVGDTNYIYKTDLLKAGVITEEEASKLDTFSGVKGELLREDKIRYTIEYINADPSEYTVEELYTMIQNLTDKVGSGSSSGGSGDSGSVDSSIIDDLQEQINENKEAISSINNESIDDLQSQIDDNTTLINTNTTLINQYSTNVSNLTNVSNSNNVFLKTYPVGSIYVSNSATNPGTLFGGTWVAFGTGRTLVGVDTSQTEFATVEKTGGAKTHTLTAAQMPEITAGFAVPVISYHGSKGVKGYAYGESFGTVGDSNEYGITSGIAGTSISSGTQYGYGIKFGNNQAHNNLQPYITVYMWKRTA